jgi:CDP-diacylglycerol--serine O-phosphatidyltransferase
MTPFLQKHYANILSLFNLICWLIALIFIIYNDYILAIIFFFFGQFFDLFDWKLARKYGSTKYGPLYDDIADSVSFWFLPWISFITIYWVNMYSLFISWIYIFSVIYRLWRFVKKDIYNETIKSWNFNWLPSPAWALLVLSFMMLKINIYVTSIVIIMVSILMMSQISFAHFWKIIMKKINKKMTLLFSIISILVIVVSQRLGNMNVFFFYCFFLWIAYMFLGWVLRIK